MELFDTHAHLDFSRFGEDREKVMERALEAGVKYIVNAGADISSSKHAIKIAKSYRGIFASAGMHPHEASRYDLDTASELKSLTEEKEVVAIGETGLDFHYDNSPREDQRQAFRSQLRIARELEMPVIIHSREAEEDTLEILDDEWNAPEKAVVHCFSSSSDMAEELISRGYLLGFTGLITFGGLDWLRSIVSRVPLDKILIETDSPYMSPEPKRGERNEPARVKFVAEEVASCHDIDLNEAARITTRNGLRLFSISEDKYLRKTE